VTTTTSQELEADVDRLAGRLRLPYLRRAAAEMIPTGRSQRFRPRPMSHTLRVEFLVIRNPTHDPF